MAWREDPMNVEPETVELLTIWNADRHEIDEIREEIKNHEARIDYLQNRMEGIPRTLANTLFRLDNPIGVKIEGDYIVVIHDEDTDHFTIQTVDFNLREEIKNES
jgi:hypothetical protein